MKTRIFILLFLSFALIASCGKKQEKTEATEETTEETSMENSSGDFSGTLKISKEEYNPGDEIIVSFTADGDLTHNAWIGLIPSKIPHGDEGVNDANDITYQYFKDKSGELTFYAPLKPGKYDLRMNSSDNDGREVTSVTFTVVSVSSDTLITISLDKGAYEPGEKIKLDFRALPEWDANAWIGLIPSEVEHGNEAVNDANDMAYQYIGSKPKGTMTFTAPDKPGRYDFRMITSDNKNGKEVKYVTFTVK